MSQSSSDEYPPSIVRELEGATVTGAATATATAASGAAGTIFPLTSPLLFPCALDEGASHARPAAISGAMSVFRRFLTAPIKQHKHVNP